MKIKNGELFNNLLDPLYLDKRSESLKVIQQMRNEAHRFGITHHRNKRSKGAIETELDNIPGIGEKTVVELLKHFRSTKRVKKATKKELEEVIGLSKAQKIIDTAAAKKVIHKNAAARTKSRLSKAIKNLGITSHHRKTFSPINKIK